MDVLRTGRSLKAPLALLASLALSLSAMASPGDPLSPRLRSRLAAARSNERQAVWVFLRDKGRLDPSSWAEAADRLTPRALARRAARGTVRGVTWADLAISRASLQAVLASGARLRHEARWLNAVSVEADASQIASLSRLPFVASLDLVQRWRRQPEPREAGPATSSATTTTSGAAHASGLDYGPSLTHLAQLHVPEAHDLGLDGSGVLVAVLDGGFDNLAHETFAQLRLVAARDFVNGDEDVASGADRGEGSHGTAVLSLLAGFRPGQLIGPAYGASFLLAKTEDTTSETPLEEDNWAAAAEWAEARGADVLSSSLGYRSFDPGFGGYTAAQLDGQTAVSTRAANQAVDFGIVVLISAGNSGFSPAGNTIGAPADGYSVLAIGAVDSTGTRASFSSVGPTADGRIKPDLVAPGVALRAAAPDAPDAYRVASGTSFSCPLTAGVVALILQAHPDWDVARVHEALRGTARRTAPPDNLTGWGLVDAQAAIGAPDGR